MRAPAALTLDATAERAFALRRQFGPADGVSSLADRLVGLHASRHSGPFVAARARIPDLDARQLAHPASAGGLVQLRCMRGTLHALTGPWAAIAHAAVQTQRRRATSAYLRRVGISRAAHARARSQLLERAALGPVPAEQAVQLAGRHSLRALWDDGELVAINLSASPLRADRRFLAAEAVPGWRPPSEDRAQNLLLAAYLTCYGPASAADIQWWTGWGLKVTLKAIERLGTDLVEIDVPGLGDGMLLLACDEGPLRRHHQAPNVVHVLAYEDPAIKAWHATRERYLAGVKPRHLFWHAGEALACVLVAGRLAATWRWNGARRSIEWTQLRPLVPDTYEQIAAALEETRRWLAEFGPGPPPSAIGEAAG